MQEDSQFKSYTIPAPVLGWNARDSVDMMKDADALELQNMFPDLSNIRLRNGYAVQATSMGTGAVPTLIDFTTKAGVQKLIAGANGNLYDCTTSGVAATSIKSGLSENYWQSIIFKNTLVLVNGTDQPLQYDGSTVTNAVYSGITDDAKLITVSQFKGRLYFIEDKTTSVWYGAAGAVTGALTEFDAGQFLDRGGSLMFAGSMTADTGSTLQDLFILVSNQGEVLIYQGSYPGGTDWTTAAHYYMSPPLGRRAFYHDGQDLLIICKDGIYSIANLFQGKTDTATDRIANAWTDATNLYSANTGWSACIYPEGKMGIINIPLASNTSYEQYVFNTVSKAWCKFTGMNGITWVNFKGGLYFGGTDGKVYKADTEASDNGAQIQVRVKWAFSYFKDRQLLKQFVLARPIFNGDQEISVSIDVDVDFEDRSLENVVSVLGSAGAVWDVAEWDDASWDSSNLPTTDWLSLSAIGRCAAIKLAGDYVDAKFSLSAVNIGYNAGGIL